MIHRDIKPDNILITNKGTVKVADMGLAKAHGENLSLTRTGTAAGTPLYMSPEQARDAKHVDHRTDIYALGAMLYACIAGKPPIMAETYIELLEAKEKGKFEPLRKANDEVPGTARPDGRQDACQTAGIPLPELCRGNHGSGGAGNRFENLELSRSIRRFVLPSLEQLPRRLPVPGLSQGRRSAARPSPAARPSLWEVATRVPTGGLSHSAVETASRYAGR